MDQMSPAPSHELPKPQQNNVIKDSGEYVVSAPESHDVAPSSERISQAATAVAQATDDTTTLAAVATPAVDNTAASSAVPFTIPTTAADINRIEKEWVDIAKFIVKNTRLDPRTQSSELSSIKHEYIKKRYGKEIKLSENKAA